MNLYNLTYQFSYLEGNTCKNKNKIFTTFLHIFHGLGKLPLENSHPKNSHPSNPPPPPPGEFLSENSNKLPIWNIPTRFVN